jgi:hypothetical protein
MYKGGEPWQCGIWYLCGGLMHIKHGPGAWQRHVPGSILQTALPRGSSTTQ